MTAATAVPVRTMSIISGPPLHRLRFRCLRSKPLCVISTCGSKPLSVIRNSPAKSFRKTSAVISRVRVMRIAAIGTITAETGGIAEAVTVADVTAEAVTVADVTGISGATELRRTIGTSSRTGMFHRSRRWHRSLQRQPSQ